MPGKTLFEKVWDAHVVAEDPGAPAVLYIDAHLVHEVTSPQAFAELRERGLPVRRLPSGAGHDAMVFPPVCPIAMLFVRCGAGGISHHPDETMTAGDAEIATAVFLDFLETWIPRAPAPR